LDSLRR